MYSSRESRGAVGTFSGADNNRHTASHWSSKNLPGIGIADHYASANNNYYTFPKATNSKENIMSFHSSTKWREYFQASKHSNKLVVIYFTATWCEPCRSIEPTIKEFAASYNDVDLVKLDVDELFNVSCEYGIQTMPTFLLMKNGKQIDKVAGAKTADLHRKIQKYRAN